MSLKLNSKIQARKRILSYRQNKLKIAIEDISEEEKNDSGDEIKNIETCTGNFSAKNDVFISCNELKLLSLTTEPEEIDKVQLVRRYVNLLKKTLVAFFLSTSLHVGSIFGYFWLYLYLNPDDQGQKDFYSQTTVSPGVNVGGKMVGGGGVQTNYHKSYLMHLIREYYKSLSKSFFIEFSLVYLLFLYLLGFFPERAKLKEDTTAAFESFKRTYETNSTTKKSLSMKTIPSKCRSITRKKADEEVEDSSGVKQIQLEKEIQENKKLY